LTFLILGAPAADRMPVALPEGLDTVRALGTALVSPDAYVLPFEVASVLLLAALVGAVYIAGVGKKG
jgi:NADH-quinone oxidoreductase subunit J